MRDFCTNLVFFVLVLVAIPASTAGVISWWWRVQSAEAREAEIQARDNWIADTIASLRTGQSSVCLYSCVNTDLMLEEISGMPEVRSVTFEQTIDLSDAGLTRLTTLPNLNALDFRGERHITDSNMAILPGCPELTSLSLKHCKFATDAGLDEVGKMTQLRTFKHDGQFSEDALNKLQTMLPECAIEMAGWCD